MSWELNNYNSVDMVSTSSSIKLTKEFKTLLLRYNKFLCRPQRMLILLMSFVNMKIERMKLKKNFRLCCIYLYFIQPTILDTKTREIMESFPFSKVQSSRNNDLLVGVYVMELLKLVVTNFQKRNKLSNSDKRLVTFMEVIRRHIE